MPKPSPGFSGGSDGKESACNVGNLGLIPGLGRSPGGGHGNQLPPVFLPGESHGQRSLAGCSPWGRRVGHNWVSIQRSFHMYAWVCVCGMPAPLFYIKDLSIHKHCYLQSVLVPIPHEYQGTTVYILEIFLSIDFHLLYNFQQLIS